MCVYSGGGDAVKHSAQYGAPRSCRKCRFRTRARRHTSRRRTIFLLITIHHKDTTTITIRNHHERQQNGQQKRRPRRSARASFQAAAANGTQFHAETRRGSASHRRQPALEAAVAIPSTRGPDAPAQSTRHNIFTIQPVVRNGVPFTTRLQTACPRTSEK